MFPSFCHTDCLQTSVDEHISTRLLVWLAGASAVAILFSIAVSQIFLGIGLVVLLFRRDLWRFPPVGWPLLALFVWTVVSKVHAEGWFVWNAQIRKFFVFGVLFLVYSAVRRISEAKWILIVICGVGALSAAWSFVQFWRRVNEARAAHESFYVYYTAQRTVGFMSHWQTFSGEMMVVLIISLGFLLFTQISVREKWESAAVAVMSGAAIILNQTRSIWLACAASTAYLVMAWRPKWLLALPVAAVAIYVVSPTIVQERALSIVRPHGTVDSNEHRYVTWRTGIEMIKAHPWLGVGPEKVAPEFMKYVPPDIPRPLPTGWYGHLHNIYLQFAAERGIPALIFLLWLFGKMTWDWTRALRPRPDADRRFLLHCGIATLIGTMVNGVFEHNIGNSEILHIFLAVAGCAYVAINAISPGDKLVNREG